MWEDARTLPKICLNCGLIKMMIEESQIGENYIEPEDSFVEQLTTNMGKYIAIQLNLGNTVSVYQAFVSCT